MGTFFNLILTQPLFNALVILYKYVTFGDLGLAIIVLTILINLILAPFFFKAMKNQALMQKIQPEIVKIQREHKGNKEKQAMAMMELWKTHKVNPFSSLILIFIQLPILIVLYKIFIQGFSDAAFIHLYSFISKPEVINNLFLGLINLSKPNMLIVALAVVAQYVRGRMSLPKKIAGAEETTSGRVGRQMVFVGPLLTLLILPQLSSAVALYWLTSTLFSIVQQKFVNKSVYGPKLTGPSQTNS